MKYLSIIAMVMGMFANSVAAVEINAASFNIWMSPNGIQNNWQDRKSSVAQLVRFHDFDVFGTQEGSYNQLDDIKASDGVYEYVGKGRDDGEKGGETSAIFFKKDKFELLDNGDFWFAETPDKPVKGWDAMCKRICSWAKLKDKKSGKIFFFFSCHFDHKGEIARKKSAELYVEMVNKIAAGFPFIGVGDFNAQPNDEPMKIIMSSPTIKDARSISQTVPYGPRSTWHGNGISTLKDRIDYIFVSNDICVKKFGVITDLLCAVNPKDYSDSPEPKDAKIKNPSDHYPVKAVLEF